MRTDDLIAQLSDRLTPVRRHAVERILLAGVGLGVIGAAIVMLAWLGPRPDMAWAMTQFHFWMKFFYTLALAVPGLWLVARAGRPGAPVGAPLLSLGLPLAAILLLALAALTAPGADTHALMMGGSANVCARNILLVGLPVLAGAFWALRRLAPTRPMLAGAAAGLLAGSAGAFVYAFHCTESAAPFVAIWYSLGIGLSALLGAIAGRWALRW